MRPRPGCADLADPHRTLLGLAVCLAGCGGDGHGDDSCASADDTGGVTYVDACDGTSEEETSWTPVADQVTVSTRFLGVDPTSSLELRIDGEDLHVRDTHAWPGGCWFHLPAGHYTLRLVIDGTQRTTAEADLAAGQTLRLLGMDHAVNGADIAVFPLDTTEPAGQWRVNVVNVAQDVKPAPLDVWLWPKGTTVDDSTSVPPASVLADLAYGASSSFLIEPYITPDEGSTVVAPPAILAFLPSGTACDPATAKPEYLAPCFGDPEDPPFVILGIYAFCAGDTIDDDPGGYCHQQWGNPGLILSDGSACW